MEGEHDGELLLSWILLSRAGLAELGFWSEGCIIPSGVFITFLIFVLSRRFLFVDWITLAGRTGPEDHICIIRGLGGF